MSARARAWVVQRPWLGELPWLVAAFGGAAWLLVVNPRLPWPAGSDWHQYVSATWYFHDRSVAAVYPDWRNPLYPYLLGATGGGWVATGQVVARAGVVAVVAGAALLGRSLGGRLCAVACVYTAVHATLLAAALHWVNPYPLLAGLTALTLGLGALAARSGHPVAAGLAGLASGLTLATDPRGLAVSFAAGVLVLLGGAGQPARRTLGGWGLHAGGVLLPLVWDHVIRVRHDVVVLPLGRQILQQREGLAFQITQHLLRDPAVAARCSPPLPTGLTVAALTDPCADALFAFNVHELTNAGLAPGLTTLAFGVLALIPAWRDFGDGGRRVLRSVGAIVVVGAAASAALLVGMRWVWYTDRYALQYAVVAVVLVPVGLGRVAGILSRRVAPWASVVAAASAMTWAHLAWPARDADIAVRRSLQGDAERGRMIAWATDAVGPEDTVYDCALVDAYLAVAPRRLRWFSLRPELPECAEREATPPPEGHAWLLVRRGPTGPGQTPSPSPETLVAAGWREVASPSSTYGIWEVGETSSGQTR